MAIKPMFPTSDKRYNSQGSNGNQDQPAQELPGPVKDGNVPMAKRKKGDMPLTPTDIPNYSKKR